MAQTSGETTVAIIKTTITNDGAVALAAAELDHATKIDAAVVAATAVPTEIETSLVRTPHGLDEITTVLVWTAYTP